MLRLFGGEKLGWPRTLFIILLFNGMLMNTESDCLVDQIGNYLTVFNSLPNCIWEHLQH